MGNRLFSAAGVAVLAGALILALPGTSQAQRGGGGGGRSGGGHTGGGHVGGGHVGAAHVGAYHGSYGYRPNYGYGLGYYGYGLGYGYGGYGGYGYNSGYGLGYGYGGAPYVAPFYNTPQVPPMQPVAPETFSNPPSTGGAAAIQVIVAPDAQIWFDGAATTQRGPNREFQTPPLDPNRTFTYQVRAVWTQNGEQVDQTRTVQVRGGRPAFVDFTSPQ